MNTTTYQPKDFPDDVKIYRCKRTMEHPYGCMTAGTIGNYIKGEQVGEWYSFALSEKNAFKDFQVPVPHIKDYLDWFEEVTDINEIEKIKNG